MSHVVQYYSNWVGLHWSEEESSAHLTDAVRNVRLPGAEIAADCFYVSCLGACKALTVWAGGVDNRSQGNASGVDNMRDRQRNAGNCYKITVISTD